MVKGPIPPKTFLQILGNGHENKICHKVPIKIEENAVFVIDSRSLKFRADDLGVWVNNGVHHCIVTCTSSRNFVSNVKVFPNKKIFAVKIFETCKIVLLSQAF